MTLAAGALEKAKNGADIPDKVAFISNLIERGNLSDGGTFSACNQSGIYRVGTENPASISDMPKNSNGEYLYYYGVLSVKRIAGVITQVYKNHLGQIATRQSWDDGRAYNNWNVPYDSAINKPTAADIGAITKKDADNNYVRQGSSGVVYQENDLVWNSPTGAYLKDNGTHSSLIWHMGLNTGSASAAQFYFDFANGGIKYRSSRDNSGFEKPWARIYSDQDKPTADDIGALSTEGTAVSATKLATPRKINGVEFDGSKDITLTANILGSYTKIEADSRYVQSVQRGAAVNPPRTSEYGPDEAPTGCVVTRVLHHPGTAYGLEFTYRPLQVYINGAWRTITG